MEKNYKIAYGFIYKVDELTLNGSTMAYEAKQDTSELEYKVSNTIKTHKVIPIDIGWIDKQTNTQNHIPLLLNLD